jgi:DNA-binding NarL/FixJ family response regulator
MQTIIIADDHPFTLMGTAAFVKELGYNVLDVCNGGVAAYNSIINRRPAIALIDVNMPGMNGIEILEKLNKMRSATNVVALTMHNEVSVFNRARHLGVKGYLLKEFAIRELEICLKEVSSNRTWFSPQLNEMLVMDNPGEDAAELEKLTFTEKKILELISAQHNTKAIAQLMYISEKTVENHRCNIIKKLNLPAERNALLFWAMKNM